MIVPAQVTTNNFCSYALMFASLLNDRAFRFLEAISRPLRNVFEAADARQARKRSLCVINEHFEPVFNTATAKRIIFQRLIIGFYIKACCSRLRHRSYFPI